MNREVRAVLVTRLRFLGDVVLSTPLLSALRTHYPNARIEYLGCAPHVDVLERHPAVDRIHRLPTSASMAEMLRTARMLRARRFDAVIDLFGNPRSALLAAATGAPLRVGPDRGVRARLYTHRRGRPEGDRSAIRHHLDKLVPLVGHEVAPTRPTLHVGEDEAAALRARLGLAEDDRVALVHPGSTWPDKAWPEQRFTQLIGWMQERIDVPVRVIEPPGEEGTASRVCKGTHAVPLPPLGVRELLALLRQSVVYVGNDGGILHAAVASGVPSLGLFGPTEPDIWFPYASFGPFRVVHRCDPPAQGREAEVLSRLRSLEVGEVVDALSDLLHHVARTRDA